MMYLYSHFGQYSGDDNVNLREGYYQKELLYRDSIYEVITPEDPYFLWYKGWRFRETNGAKEPDESLQVGRRVEVVGEDPVRRCRAGDRDAGVDGVGAVDLHPHEDPVEQLGLAGADLHPRRGGVLVLAPEVEA